MTELTPHPSLPVLEDPGVTRLLERPVSDEDAALLARTGSSTATSACVVVPVLDDRGVLGLESVLGWEPPHVRLEVLAVAHEGDPVRSTVRSTMMGSGRSWRILDHPRGGRVGALAAAAEAAEHEFLVVAGPAARSPELLDRVPATLVGMWRDGADAAVIGAGQSRSVDAAAYLVAGLGLDGRTDATGVVVLRRWVARWIFNEATRAIGPADEIADRTRLLGVGILAVDARDDGSRRRDHP